MTISIANKNTFSATNNITSDLNAWGFVSKSEYSIVNNWLASKIDERVLVSEIEKVSNLLSTVKLDSNVERITLMVAGGVMRDTLLKANFKDIDVFVHAEENGAEVLDIVGRLSLGSKKTYLNKGSWIEKSHIRSVYAEETNVIAYYDDTPEQFKKDPNEFILNEFNTSCTRIGFSMDCDLSTGVLSNPRWYCNRADIKDFLQNKVIHMYHSYRDSKEDIINTINKYKSKKHLEEYTLMCGKNSTHKASCIINNVDSYEPLKVSDVKGVCLLGTSMYHKAILAKEGPEFTREWSEVITPEGYKETES